MMVSVICNYEVNSFGVEWVMSFRKASISHGFWAVFTIPLFICGVAFSCKVIWGFQITKNQQIWCKEYGGKKEKGGTG